MAEVADCASDQLGEYSCYLEPAEDSELYGLITREVFSRFGLGGYESDSTMIATERLSGVAERGVVE